MWHDTRINIIDTPGHVDFTVEVERSMRVLDGVVAIFCAKGGVEPPVRDGLVPGGSLPCSPGLRYINKMDIVGADFFKVLRQLREKLHAHVLPLQLPIGAESKFSGVIDLTPAAGRLFMKTISEFTAREAEIPEEMRDQAADYRERILETAAEYDDLLMEKYFKGQEISPEECYRALRKATIHHALVPVFCGSSYRNKGVQPLLQAVVTFLPSPHGCRCGEGI